MAHGVHFDNKRAINMFPGVGKFIPVRMAIAHMDGNRLFIYLSPREIMEGEKPSGTEELMNKELLAEWMKCDPRKEQAPKPHHLLEFADEGWFRWPESALNLHSKNKEGLLSWIHKLIKENAGIARFIVELGKMQISDGIIVAEKLTIIDFRDY